jgi:adenosine kinase
MLIPQNIILAGSIAIDRIMNFDGKFEEAIKPDKLHVLSLSVLLSNIVDTPGGVAANIAYNLAMLGEMPLLVGAVGSNGKEYMDDLQVTGVDTSKVHFSDLPTATFTVLTDSNDCQVGGFYPGAMADESQPSLSSLVENKNQLVVISAHDPELMARQVEECRENGYRLFYDISQQVSNVTGDQIKAGLEVAELLIVNDYEMQVIQDKTEFSFEKIKKMVPLIIITLGGDGAAIYDQRSKNITESKVRAIPDVKVIDPTGAGDAFRAGFLYGYVRDWDVETCVKWGSVTASFAIEKRGTQAHTFDNQEIEKLVEKYYKA